MPLDAFEALLSLDSFEAMGTLNTVVVDDASALPEAMAIAKAHIKEVDETCSRFRLDSELSRLNRRAGKGEVSVSALLEEAIAAALVAAEISRGLVDPTVGRVVEELGYTVSFGDLPSDGPPVELRVRTLPGWRSIGLDRTRHSVCLPSGVALDLGASGKSWAADRTAEAVAHGLKVGVAVECGGDVAVRGREPSGGWPVRIAAGRESNAWLDVTVHDGGLATSGTTSRRWRRGGVELHDIIDPRTGLPADTPWEMVTVAARTCLEANAGATAGIVMGEDAPEWFDDLRLPARLVRRGGAVVLAGGWAA